MKIAFFSDCYLDLTGGIVTAINAEKAELKKRGHTVAVFSSAYPRPKKELTKLAKQHIYPVPSCKIFARGLTPISRRPKIVMDWLEKTHPELKDFDIFYIHYEAGCSIAALKLAKKYRIPAIQVMHGREDMGETNIIPRGFRTLVATILNFAHSLYLPHPIKIRPDNYLANSRAKAKMWSLMVNHANAADLVLTPSEHFAKKLKHYGVSKKIIPLKNGISDAICPKNLTPRVLGPNETLKIIWHSRVSAEKRMMPFLRALKSVDGPYHLDVFGGGGDFFRAKRFARRHHLNVTFRGNAKFDMVYKTLQNSHLDVLVSCNFDTFGMTLIEAASVGVPTLIVDPDMKEILPKGGFLFAKNPSPEAMAAAINELFKNPDKLTKMSKILIENRDAARISRRIDALEKIFESAIIKES